MNEIINTAHTDPEVRSLRLRSTSGGDESRRPPVVAAGGVNRTEGEGGGEAVATVQQVPLTALNDLSSAVGKSRLLCEGLWGRAFLTAYNSANDGERLRMAEGLGKGAGLALLAVPMVEAFTFCPINSSCRHHWRASALVSPRACCCVSGLELLGQREQC